MLADGKEEGGSVGAVADGCCWLWVLYGSTLSESCLFCLL